jgi:hypothetical protein
MQRSLFIPMGMLATALALGCGDQQPSTAPAADLPAPSLGVERGTAEFGFGFSDGRRTVFVGLTIEDMINICAGTEHTNDQLNQLTVTRPDGSFKLLLRGEENVVVLEAVGLPCDNLLDVPRLTGTARVVVTDSDVDLTGHGADASMLHVTGTVTDESGQLYHLVALNHQVVDPSNTSFDNFQKIRLTPIGG